jgi:hypothetical protein
MLSAMRGVSKGRARLGRSPMVIEVALDDRTDPPRNAYGELLFYVVSSCAITPITELASLASHVESFG